MLEASPGAIQAARMISWFIIMVGCFFGCRSLMFLVVLTAKERCLPQKVVQIYSIRHESCSESFGLNKYICDDTMLTQSPSRERTVLSRSGK